VNEEKIEKLCLELGISTFYSYALSGNEVKLLEMIYQLTQRVIYLETNKIEKDLAE